MVTVERMPIPVASGVRDRARMTNATEQAVFSFLRHRLENQIPGSQIRYETTKFSSYDDQTGQTRGTVPDIHITKPDGREIFLEITNSGRGRKARQMAVMNNFPEVKYVVWGRSQLQHIEKIARKKDPNIKLLPKGGMRTQSLTSRLPIAPGTVVQSSK